VKAAVKRALAIDGLQCEGTEIEDWTRLFTQADQRLKLYTVIRPLGSVNSILEVGFDEDA
jgi:hypothetical protein